MRHDSFRLAAWFPGSLAMLAACNDAGVAAYNSAPTTSIITPEDGAQFDPGALVEFYGVAKDSQTIGPELQIRWDSSIDGVLSTDPPDINGDLHMALNTLSAGEHVITLSAVDAAGDSGTASILLTVGAGGNDVGAPAIVILSPAEGMQYGSSEPLTLLATVTDDVDDPATLPVEVLDVPDGVIFNGYPSATSTLEVLMDPSVGVHIVEVTALDSEGNIGSASVGFEVVQDNVPIVNITSPADGAGYDTVDTITFKGTVSDDVTPVEQIATSWTSDIQGLLNQNPPDSSGVTSFGGALMAGVHVVTLTATDLDGNIGRDTITLTIEDPNDRDDDGDGYTENEGDCDDTDDTISPGEVDICDDIDNNCDGYINEPYWDTYEPNNAIGTAYSLGEVDVDFFWTGSTLELAGLTFSDRTDEDWFYWEANDEIWDNVSVSVVVSDLKASGDYVVELYDDGGNILGSDSGSGAISVYFESDIWDDGDDAFYVRIYATTWPTASCSQTYDLQIRS